MKIVIEIYKYDCPIVDGEDNIENYHAWVLDGDRVYPQNILNTGKGFEYFKDAYNFAQGIEIGVKTLSDSNVIFCSIVTKGVDEVDLLGIQ